MALVPHGAGWSSVSLTCPVLTPANYTVWAIKAEAILDAAGVWEAVSPADGVAVDANDLIRLIDKTRFAISTEETRYYLNGLYLHTVVENGQTLLRAVATDGHRLALAEMVIDGVKTNIPLQQRIMSDVGFQAGGQNIHYLEKRIAEQKEKGIALG